jgi:enterochelin esterase-like enzyme
LAAAYAALEQPQVFGNVLSQSGAFTLNPDWAEESGWMALQYTQRDQLPLRFHLDA